MDRDDAESRVRVWAALGNQPGAGIWFAVWLLSRLSGATATRRHAGPKGASLRKGANQVCVGH